MSPIQLTEPIVAGLVARLAVDGPLGAAIDTLNASLGDEITVRQPVLVLDHLPTLEVMTDFPVVAVGEGGGSFEDDEGSSMTGRYQFAVCVYESDADRQLLATRLRRMRTAVARVVLDGRTIPTADGTGVAAWGVRPLRLLPGDVLADFDQHTRTVQSFMSWCGLVIEATRDEDA